MIPARRSNSCLGISDAFRFLHRNSRVSYRKKRALAHIVFAGAEPDLPPQLIRARKIKQFGLASSSALFGTGIAFLVTSNAQLPRVPKDSLHSLGLLAAALVVFVLALAVYKVQKEDLEVEIHNGTIYLQWNLPPKDGPRMEEGAVLVRPAGKKGNGAFATKEIAKGTYLGDYEGELLEEKTYWQRYPTGVADYCMGIDREWTLDGRDRAKDTTKFSPVHMNHSSTRQNVTRRCSRADRRVSFYAARDIQIDEELLLDYGETYWTGRKNAIIE